MDANSIHLAWRVSVWVCLLAQCLSDGTLSTKCDTIFMINGYSFGRIVCLQTRILHWISQSLSVRVALLRFWLLVFLFLLGFSLSISFSRNLYPTPFGSVVLHLSVSIPFSLIFQFYSYSDSYPLISSLRILAVHMPFHSHSFHFIQSVTFQLCAKWKTFHFYYSCWFVSYFWLNDFHFVSHLNNRIAQIWAITRPFGQSYT